RRPRTASIAPCWPRPGPDGRQLKYRSLPVDETLMEAASIPWRPIGELFVEKGLISQDQLEEALAEQAATGLRLGEILVKQSLISSPELTQALMEQLGREVAKEEGFGTGLWSEIRRRNAVPQEAEAEADGT